MRGGSGSCARLAGVFHLHYSEEVLRRAFGGCFAGIESG